MDVGGGWVSFRAQLGKGSWERLCSQLRKRRYLKTIKLRMNVSGMISYS